MGTAPERRCGRRGRLCRGLVAAVPGATAAAAAARGRLWALELMSSSLGYPLRRDGVGAAPERCGGYRGVSRPSRRRAWRDSHRGRCKGAALGAFLLLSHPDSAGTLSSQSTPYIIQFTPTYSYPHKPSIPLSRLTRHSIIINTRRQSLSCSD